MKLESLKSGKFESLGKSQLLGIFGGETVPGSGSEAGKSRLKDGTDVEYSSDCSEWVDGRYHIEFYDEEGKMIAEYWQ